MIFINSILNRIGGFLAARLAKESTGYKPYTPSDQDTLLNILQPGDVLLVEGNQLVSSGIKYLTQSTWSHAAFFIGDALAEPLKGNNRKKAEEQEPPRLIEVNVGKGCRAVPLSKYENFNTRICRPVGLSYQDKNRTVEFMISKIGLQYDLKNIFDLMRYFIPTPPVPVALRRRMIAFGSGEPSKAICSSLIAQAFQEVKYPILPEVTFDPNKTSAKSGYSKSEILHIRFHALFTPRDFDLSPYFDVIKPTIESGFNYKDINWSGEVSQRDVVRGIDIPLEES